MRRYVVLEDFDLTSADAKVAGIKISKLPRDDNGEPLLAHIDSTQGKFAGKLIIDADAVINNVSFNDHNSNSLIDIKHVTDNIHDALASAPNPSSSNHYVTVDEITSGLVGKMRDPVQDIATLRTITELEDKLMCLVEDAGLYRFDAQSSSPDDGNLVIRPDSIVDTDPGRWFKITTTIAKHNELSDIHDGSLPGPYMHLSEAEYDNIKSAATSTNNGYATSAQIAKLDGIQDNAINQATADTLYVNVTGDTMSGNLDMGNNNILNVNFIADSNDTSIQLINDRILFFTPNDILMDIGYLDMYGNNIINVSTITATNTSGLALYDNGGNGIFVQIGGNVGIGTSSPNEKLDVYGNISIKSGSTLQKAMSGDLHLACSPATYGSLADTLNAADAGTYTVDVTINLQDAAGLLHKWSSNPLSITTAITASDSDIAAPTVSNAAPNLADGTVTVTLTYDTDAGATKTYAAGDIITMTVSSANILGYAIADAIFTDTVS